MYSVTIPNPDGVRPVTVKLTETRFLNLRDLRSLCIRRYHRLHRRTHHPQTRQTATFARYGEARILRPALWIAAALFIAGNIVGIGTLPTL